MSALKTRSRVVVFRLTEDEYDFLQQSCRTAGGRNISDFTRNGLLSHLETATNTDRFAAIEERLETLQRDIRALQDSVTRRYKSGL